MTSNNISKLNIKLNLDGTIKDKNIKFVPKMIIPSIKSDIIYFPLNGKITNELIKTIIKENTPDAQTLFTDFSLFNKFIRYVTDPIRYKSIQLGSKKALEIANHNIKFIVNAFFKKYIFINGKSFKIISFVIDDKETKIPTTKTDLTTKITLNLKLIEREKDNLMNRTRLTCDDKRKNIDKTYNDLFGTPFFERTNKITASTDDMVPVMYSNVKKGTTMGKQPEKIKKQVYPYPYGYQPYYYPPFNPNIKGHPNKKLYSMPQYAMPQYAMPQYAMNANNKQPIKKQTKTIKGGKKYYKGSNKTKRKRVRFLS